jgi:hypothetical protein
MNVKKIVTHKWPHVDELFAIWLLRNFGENTFPGVSTAEIEYWSTGGLTPDGRTAGDYENEGTLLIGVGGGHFDEHPGAEEGRKEEKCAATLVAEALGISEFPELEKLLKFVSNNDLKGSASPFDIAYLPKVLHQQFPNDPQKVMDWVFVGFEAKYFEQRRFFIETTDEFWRVTQIERVIGPHGEALMVAVISSDNPDMSKFARSEYGCRAAVVIQKRSDGHIMVSTNQKYGLRIHDIVKMLRVREQELEVEAGELKPNEVVTNWKELMKEGRIGTKRWWFQEKIQNIFNGSLTATDVPVTRISLEDILEIVLTGLDPKRFEPSFSANCLQGKCLSSSRNKCPWYKFGLSRCGTIRYKEIQAKK